MADKVKQVGDLILKAQTEQKDAAAASASSAKEMVGSLTRAADEAARLASALASAAVSTVASAAAGSMPIDDPVADIEGQAQEQQANTNAYLKALTDMSPAASDLGLPAPSEPSTYADGGIVRRTGIALVHKGEVVLNEDQQAAAGRSVTVNLNISGYVSSEDGENLKRLTREHIVPEIEKVWG